MGYKHNINKLRLLGYKREYLFINGNCNFKSYTTLKTIFKSDFTQLTENNFIELGLSLMQSKLNYNAMLINYQNNIINSIRFTKRALHIKYEQISQTEKNIAFFNKEKLNEVKNGWIINGGSSLSVFNGLLYEWPIGLKFSVSYDNDGVDEEIETGSSIGNIESGFFSGSIIDLSLNSVFNHEDFTINRTTGVITVQDSFINNFVEMANTQYDLFVTVTNRNTDLELTTISKKLSFNVLSLQPPDNRFVEYPPSRVIAEETTGQNNNGGRFVGTVNNALYGNGQYIIESEEYGNSFTYIGSRKLEVLFDKTVGNSDPNRLLHNLTDMSLIFTFPNTVNIKSIKMHNNNSCPNCNVFVSDNKFSWNTIYGGSGVDIGTIDISQNDFTTITMNDNNFYTRYVRIDLLNGTATFIQNSEIYFYYPQKKEFVQYTS